MDLRRFDEPQSLAKKRFKCFSFSGLASPSSAAHVPRYHAASSDASSEMSWERKGEIRKELRKIKN